MSSQILESILIDSYNVVIWAPTDALFDKYRSCSTEKIEAHKTITFQCFMLSPSSTTNLPTVCDCVLFLLDDVESAKAQIPSALERFKAVWNKKGLVSSLSKEKKELGEDFHLELYTKIKQALLALHEDDVRLTNLIYETFASLDIDNSGYIDVGEMQTAATKLGEPIEESDITQALEEMDTNSDGQISLSEFAYWWKRGRHGAISFRKVLGGLATKLAAIVPGATQLLHSIGVTTRRFTRKTLKKSLDLSIGPAVTQPRSAIKVGVGKSRKKEEFINQANNALGFNTKFCWLAFGLSFKSPSIAGEAAQTLSTAQEAQLQSLEAGAYDRKTLREMLEFKAVAVDRTVYAGGWLDNAHPLVETAFQQLSFVDEVFNTPVDDYVTVECKTNADCQALLSGNCSGLWTSGSHVSVACEHWVNLKRLVAPLATSATQLFPLFMAGDLKLRVSPGFLEAQPSLGLGKVPEMLVGLLKQQLPLLSAALKQVLKGSSEEISLYARYNNIGCCVELSGDTSTKAFSQLL